MSSLLLKLTKQIYNKCFLKLSITTLSYSLLIGATNAHAFSIEEYSGDELDYTLQNLERLKVTGNALSWDIFADTQENEECTIDAEGYDLCLIKPIYSPTIKALDGKQVTVMGFMFPLDPNEEQRNFLLGPYPASCPFHYHSGPAEMVEVIISKPVKFSYDPVTVTGRLSLEYNQETGIFYYLRDM